MSCETHPTRRRATRSAGGGGIPSVGGGEGGDALVAQWEKKVLEFVESEDDGVRHCQWRALLGSLGYGCLDD